MSSVITGWILAVALGMRHASEPDHLVAVTTLVAGSRDARGAAKLGALWGIGHSITLLAVGGALMICRWRLPERLADWFELGVAIMLLGLGVRSIGHALRLRAAARESMDGHEHAHDQRLLRASTALPHTHRSLAVGLVHGLAGSGALTALALSTMPSLGSGFAYMAFFALGSVVGMAALSGLIGVPLARFTQRLRVRVAALASAGVLSLVVGVTWGWPLLWRVSAG